MNRKERLPIISEGNSKLGAIANVSLTPCVTCPKDAPCRKTCYALKAYRQYKQVRKAWDHNTRLARQSRKAYFDGIRAFLSKESPKRFRWHVAGDLPSQAYLDAIKAIAREFPDIQFLCFTKNYDLNFRRLPGNLSVVFSMWNHYGNTSKAMPRAWYSDPSNPDPRIPAKAIPCPGSCENCWFCWHLKDLKRDVVFEKH